MKTRSYTTDKQHINKDIVSLRVVVTVVTGSGAEVKHWLTLQVEQSCFGRHVWGRLSRKPTSVQPKLQGQQQSDLSSYTDHANFSTVSQQVGKSISMSCQDHSPQDNQTLSEATAHFKSLLIDTNPFPSQICKFHPYTATKNNNYNYHSQTSNRFSKSQSLQYCPC